MLYVSFGSKVRPRSFGCVPMGIAVLFTFRSIFLVYSAGSAVNRVQVVLSGFSVRLFYFCTRSCRCRCDGDVICVGHDLNRCSGWWYVCSVNVE